MSFIIDKLRKIFPPSIHSFNLEMDRVLRAIEEERQSIVSLSQKIDDQNHLISNELKNISLQTSQIKKQTSEAVWAHIFHDTIVESTWLKDKTFSPGRWAVGYPYLYVMYRILNEVHPKRILELGLGQSTKMIAQYATSFDDVKHVVVENGKSWNDFMLKSFQLSERSSIVQLDLEMATYKEDKAIRVYKNFKEQFVHSKFDFILIDGPIGSDMQQYSRIDILNILPGCIGEDFVIMMDDCERTAENQTTLEIERCLKRYSIPYKRGRYVGQKEFVLILSKNLEFITSM